AEVQKNGRRARIVPTVDGIVQLVAPEMRSGDVVAILSNGGFGGIYEKLRGRLQSLMPGHAKAGNKIVETQLKP
ncbi:MAG TPA: hypothetical protein VKR57_04630, partial [Terriglobales bacterium]|nr:hypothetical protein [Terriglobales bacterium]